MYFDNGIVNDAIGDIPNAVSLVIVSQAPILKHAYAVIQPDYAVLNRYPQGIVLKIRSLDCRCPFHEIHVFKSKIAYSLASIGKVIIFDSEHLSLGIGSQDHIVHICFPRCEKRIDMAVFPVENAAVLHLDHVAVSGHVGHVFRHVPMLVHVTHAARDAGKRIVRLFVIERLGRRIVAVMAVDIGVVHHVRRGENALASGREHRSPKEDEHHFFHKTKG